MGVEPNGLAFTDSCLLGAREFVTLVFEQFFFFRMASACSGFFGMHAEVCVVRCEQHEGSAAETSPLTYDKCVVMCRQESEKRVLACLFPTFRPR